MTKYQEKQVNALNRANLIEILNTEGISYAEDMPNAELRALILKLEVSEEPESPDELTNLEGEEVTEVECKSNLDLKSILSKRTDKIAFNSRPKDLSAISAEIAVPALAPIANATKPGAISLIITIAMEPPI